MATVDVSELIGDLETEAARIRDDAADRVVEAAKQDAPVGQDVPFRTTPAGTLRDSLQVFATFDESPTFTAEVGSDLDYAQFTDDVDTAPHPIFARNVRVLRFWWDNGPRGAGVYRFRSVNHPGTTGQHWFTEKNPERWQSALSESV